MAEPGRNANFENESAEGGHRQSALVILGALAEQHGPLTVAELAKLTSLHRASLYRNIEGLADEGLVRRIAGTPRRYAVGLEFIRIGFRAIRHFDLRVLLLPALVEFASGVGMPCSLIFYDHGEGVVTDTVHRTEPPIIPVPEGIRTPLHAHGMGRAMLAFQDDEEIDRVLARPLERFTETTTTDAARLREELAKARAAGYAFVWGERHPNFGTAGFPVLDRSGVAVAALGSRVVVPEGPAPAVISLGKLVSERASAQLGYRPPMMQPF